MHVHPDDRNLLEEYVQSLDTRVRWVADTNLVRGGCRVESGAASVDASLERRLQQAVEAVWGDLAEPARSTAPEDTSVSGDDS